MSSLRRRRATHAGSWYDSSSERLNKSLTKWLEQSSIENQKKNLPVKGTSVHAIIGPHAGYSYSGPSSAYGYSTIDTTKFSRIIILGPSHHVYIRDKCALTNTDVLETPIGDLKVDKDVINELLKLNDNFIQMDLDMDESEHSIEMHLPYIKKIFEKDNNVKIIPIVVGSLSEQKEKEFGKILSSWLGDGETFFVISSDFCHWGTRFRYSKLFSNNYECVGNTNQSYQSFEHSKFVNGNSNDDKNNKQLEIWESIERLDHEGMSIIESGNHSQFCEYIHRTENTICGRHAIGILMTALATCSAHSDKDFTTTFLHYTQSSKCRKMSDSSVSYASAIIFTTDSPSASHFVHARAPM